MTDTASAPTTAPAAPADAAPTTINTYEYNVVMPCGGCSGAVERALKKADGVIKVVISLEHQSVKVTTTLSKEAIFEIIEKTGKVVKYAPAQSEETKEETEKASA
ncbi:Cytosolic copper metallochaperone [Coemansia asiatica]|uniref:Cytosolic copper metallochaperone n=1 Tax=Coemansia asiatica TaxID=1052880 RepID=A0A9W7XNQ4_9FUNG|nr:Cytosolic copper metallochaperone [Coemansia asiatica]